MVPKPGNPVLLSPTQTYFNLAHTSTSNEAYNACHYLQMPDISQRYSHHAPSGSLRRSLADDNIAAPEPRTHDPSITNPTLYLCHQYLISECLRHIYITACFQQELRLLPGSKAFYTCLTSRSNQIKGDASTSLSFYHCTRHCTSCHRQRQNTKNKTQIQ